MTRQHKMFIQKNNYNTKLDLHFLSIKQRKIIQCVFSLYRTIKQELHNSCDQESNNFTQSHKLQRNQPNKQQCGSK